MTYAETRRALLQTIRTINLRARTCRRSQVTGLLREVWTAKRNLLQLRAKHYGYTYDLSWLTEQIGRVS